MSTVAALLLAAVGLTQAAVAAGPDGQADYSVLSARPSPAWLRQGVIYEVFPRAFSARGDLNAVTEQLDRLQALGVDILYLMPVNPQGTLKAKGTLGSPYAIRDYYGINPAYGTAADLKRLVAEAHKRGLHVVLDMVLNHTAWDSVLMQHPDYYVRDEAGRVLPPRPEWQDVAHLDFRNPALRRYMKDLLVHWLKEFDLDGFRCDAAGEVPTDFWEEVRPELDRVKPGLMMLAEWEEPRLLARAFDIDYAWTFYHALGSALLGQSPASGVRAAWEQAAARYERQALRMRFIDNQDELRAVAQFGLPASLAAAALVLTMDGVPLLYNGMEVGDTTESGAPVLFERLPIFWAIAERRPDVQVFYRTMIAFRHAHAALTQGEVRWLPNADETRVLTFERLAADERLVVAVNLSSQAFSGAVNVEAGDYQEVTPRGLTAAAAGAGCCAAISLPPWGFRVFQRVGAVH